jgi:3',5'-cyclic AMP phosphodiesterase CpdA
MGGRVLKNLQTGFQCINKREIFLAGVSSVVFMGDIGCTYFPEKSQRILAKILKIETDLFVVLGDLSFLGEVAEIENTIAFCNQRVNVPLYALCGNHDMKGYSQVLGLKNYALVLDRLVILALDNSNGTFQRKSLSFADEILSKFTDKRFVVTFHVPPPSNLKAKGMEYEHWQQLTSISDKHKERIDCILTGHLHAFQEYNLDGYRIFITGGGGAPLYNLEDDPLKLHHAIRVSGFEEASLQFEVIPVESCEE